MNQVNECLEQLWSGNLSEDTKENSVAMNHALVDMEKGNGVENAGVQQLDNLLECVEK